MSGQQQGDGERVALTGGAVLDKDLYGGATPARYLAEVVDEEMEDEPGGPRAPTRCDGQSGSPGALGAAAAQQVAAARCSR
jgi:hypothetical protein